MAENIRRFLESGWTMQRASFREDVLPSLKEQKLPTTVPSSVLTTLLANNYIDDPYFGDNEEIAFAISKEDFTYENTFTITEKELSAGAVVLCFDGLDTLADIYLNGQKVQSVSNMHLRYRKDVKSFLVSGENVLEIRFSSPVEYITKEHAKDPIWGVNHATPGFPHIRKAHYMFGWDWGPSMPDMGIFRDVSLLLVYSSVITDVEIRQIHSVTKYEVNERPQPVKLCVKTTAHVMDEKLYAIVTVARNCDRFLATSVPVEIVAKEKDPLEMEYGDFVFGTAESEVTIDMPEIWWPNGLGEQPLYEVEVDITTDKGGFDVVDHKIENIGLRLLTVSTEKDEFGNEFCFMVNGHKIFAMGADYIPEDSLLPYGTKERDIALLTRMKEDNFNCVRVWGGGLYPSNEFYAACDRLGLIVWQDFMYACAVYRLTEEFKKSVILEAIDNIKRFRNHPSLGLLCGNNEVESAIKHWGIGADEDIKQDYLTLFEDILPTLCNKHCPDVFYWPSSPSTEGGDSNPDAMDMGDSHYWAVWHSLKPKQEFMKYYFRFCSEYGFVSLPNLHTLKAVIAKEDLYFASPVLKRHFRCEGGVEKLNFYMEEETGLKKDIADITYATQMLQADAIRANVEHMRRYRGRCMGSVYWQINDANPGISWSSLDYFGRYKALQYYAGEFYAPILLSVEALENGRVSVYITNETLYTEKLSAKVYLLPSDATSETLKATGKLLYEGSFEALPLSSKVVFGTDLKELLAGGGQKSNYLHYELYDENGELLSEANRLFTETKNFDFAEPELSVSIDKTEDGDFLVTVSSDVFAKGICLDLENYEADGKKIEPFFEENWFDVLPGRERTVKLTVKGAEVSAHEIAENLSVVSIYDILH